MNCFSASASLSLVCDTCNYKKSLLIHWATGWLLAAKLLPYPLGNLLEKVGTAWYHVIQEPVEHFP
jgi:hypothetical protein